MVLVLPSSALVLPAVLAGDDEEVAALRAAVDGLPSLDGTEVVVAAADPAAIGGPTWLAPPDGEVHLGGLGLADLRTHVEVTPPVGSDAPAGSRGSHGTAAPTTAVPGVDLSVLAVWAAQRGARSVRPLALPADAADAGADVDVEIPAQAVLVAAGDLAPVHGPKPPRPDLDPARATAVEQALLATLGGAATDGAPSFDDPAGAVAAGIRGAASLHLARTAADRAGLAVRSITRTEVAGVGGVVAAWA